MSNPIKMDDFGPSVNLHNGTCCLKCNEDLDGATPVGSKAYPQPDDVSMCAYCGNIAIFDNDLKLRELHDDEKDILEHPDLVKLIEARKCQLN